MFCRLLEFRLHPRFLVFVNDRIEHAPSFSTQPDEIKKDLTALRMQIERSALATGPAKKLLDDFTEQAEKDPRLAQVPAYLTEAARAYPIRTQGGSEPLELAVSLAIMHHESGFNPDSRGSYLDERTGKNRISSATGIGQCMAQHWSTRHEFYQLFTEHPEIFTVNQKEELTALAQSPEFTGRSEDNFRFVSKKEAATYAKIIRESPRIACWQFILHVISKVPRSPLNGFDQGNSKYIQGLYGRVVLGQGDWIKLTDYFKARNSGNSHTIKVAYKKLGFLKRRAKKGGSIASDKRALDIYRRTERVGIMAVHLRTVLQSDPKMALLVSPTIESTEKKIVSVQPIANEDGVNQVEVTTAAGTTYRVEFNKAGGDVTKFLSAATFDAAKNLWVREESKT